MEKLLFKEGNECIKFNDIDGLKICCKKIYNFDKDYCFDNKCFFQRFFNNICIYGTSDMIILFMQYYYELSLCDRLFLRQLFFYGKYLIKKNKKINNKWYNDTIIPLIAVS
tara:strand:+ start:867 stop:1199 length:333 start_codon:yes stop_codon:yes gene_type:complete